MSLPSRLLILSLFVVTLFNVVSCVNTSKEPEVSEFEKVRGTSVWSEELGEDIVGICETGNHGEYTLNPPFTGASISADGEVFSRKYSNSKTLYTLDIVLNTSSGKQQEAVCGVILNDAGKLVTRLHYLATRDLNSMSF